MFGSALLLTGVALLGLGLGALLRNTAGAISTLFGLLYGLTIAAGFLPGHLSERGPQVPARERLGADITAVHRAPPARSRPWTGFGLFCLYTAVALGLRRLAAAPPRRLTPRLLSQCGAGR